SLLFPCTPLFRSAIGRPAGGHGSRSVIVIRVGGFLRFERRVLLQQIHGDLDRLFELRVFTPPPRRRIEIHIDIGGRAVIFDVPPPLQGFKKHPPRRHPPPPAQLQGIVYAPHTPPPPL